jgi:hypothetical protein
MRPPPELSLLGGHREKASLAAVRYHNAHTQAYACYQAELAIDKLQQDTGALAPAARDGAPYRDGSTAILTPPGRGPMLISKIPLRTQYARMAAYQVRRIGPAFGIWLLLHALIGGLWRSDLALLGVASAPAWVAVGVAIAGVLIAVATQGGPPPWSIGPLDEAGARATPRKK